MGGRRDAAKPGEATRLRVCLFPGDSAPCPAALAPSTWVGSSVRKRDQVVTSWTGVLGAQFIPMMHLHFKASSSGPERLHPAASRQNPPLLHPVLPERTLQPSNGASFHALHSSYLSASRPPSPDSELLENGGCFIICLLSQSLRLRYLT